MVCAFAEDEGPAGRLALTLGIPLGRVDLHILPDGESLPNVGRCPPTVLLYRALDRPDGKLMALLLACDAFRRAGVARLVLVAPYMPYLRQDAVFAPGQPLSRDVIGALLGPRFERVVTVQPHLHRTGELTPVFAGTPVSALSAAAALARKIGDADNPIIVGPDAESEPWAAGVAGQLGAAHLVLQKVRRGDRDVDLTLPPGTEVGGRRVVLVDDICSTGATLRGAIRRLRAAGAASVEVAVVHALGKPRVTADLRRAGARSVISTDSCAHPTNAIHLASLLAGALSQELGA